MTFDHPLVGRLVRFEGRDRGTEGIVLAIEIDGYDVTFMLERTKHPILPPELDGSRPVVFVRAIAQKGDQFFVKPSSNKLVVDERDLRCTIRQEVALLLGREFQITEVDGNMQRYADQIIDQVLACCDRQGG